MVKELPPDASGLEAADQIEKDNPFAAYEGFKSSLGNLSAAVLPKPTITTGLDLLSDTLNGLRERIKAGDPMVTGTAGLAATAAAGWATWKVAAGIGGLITAGTNLNISAAVAGGCGLARWRGNGRRCAWR